MEVFIVIMEHVTQLTVWLIDAFLVAFGQQLSSLEQRNEPVRLWLHRKLSFGGSIHCYFRSFYEVLYK